MKTIIEKLTNEEIYNRALALNASFTNNETYFPALVSFAIQKNKDVFIKMAEEIENGRMKVVQHFGVPQEDGNYNISADNIEAANKELSDLLTIEQDVKIFVFGIDALEDVKLTSQETQAIMFMIDME